MKKIYIKASDYFKNGILTINCVTDSNESEYEAQFFEIKKDEELYPLVEIINKNLGKAFLVTEGATPTTMEGFYFTYDKEKQCITSYEFTEAEKQAIALQQNKQKKLSELQSYDSSTAVNSFTINGIEMWLDKATRTSLTTLANACQKLGQEKMQLQIKEGVFVELPTEQVLQILAMIELYAGQCYIVTQQHNVAISKLETMTEIEVYDFEKGYPKKLIF